MDATRERFAYRCLPLTIANSHGWELISPCAFETVWRGDQTKESIEIVPLSPPKSHLPETHFGEGIITFHPGYLFRTDPGYDLYVAGPANIRKDGIAPLTAVVETDWMPFTFTMNWVFTRANTPVRFEEGEPICQLFPIPKTLVDDVEPEIRDIASEPELHAAYFEWLSARNQFNADLPVAGTNAARDKWQRFYMRGTLPNGRPATDAHRTRVDAKPFVDRSDQAPAAGR